jgi:hypothetical protein
MEATLQVTASAITPLTFQWQFNGEDLAGAISNRLILTNVTLADLGVYRVMVRDASSQVTSQPAAVKLARWTQLVAFGDSECLAQLSNGSAWVDNLDGLLSLPTSSIKNYAVGGAGTLEVRSQINQYLSANKPDTNVLLAPWWAGVSSDFGHHFPVVQVVSNYAVNLSLLAQAGPASALRGVGRWRVAIGRTEHCDQRHDGVLGPAAVLPRLAVGAMTATPIP